MIDCLIGSNVSQKYDFVDKFLINTGYPKVIGTVEYLLQFVIRTFFYFVLKKRKHNHSSHKYCKKGTGNKMEKKILQQVSAKLSKLMRIHTRYDKHTTSPIAS